MAIIYAADGVRFVATAASRRLLLGRLAAYVRTRCDDVLWGDAASEVGALLDNGNLEGAITRYFARIGERWDEERLELLPVDDWGAWTADREWVADARR